MCKGDSTLLRLLICYAFFSTGLTMPLVAQALSFTNPGPGGGSDLWEIAFHPTDPNTFYLGGDIEGPFKTTDGGVSYERVTRGLADTSLPAGLYASQDLEIDPQDPETVYLASWSGLYKSTNGAASWTLLSPDQPIDGENQNVGSVAVSPFNGELVLAGIGSPFSADAGISLIQRSTNAGTTWTNIDLAGSGIVNGDEVVIFEILFDPVNNGVVFAATGEGIIKSTDNGLTWTLMNTGLPTGSGNTRPVVHDLIGTLSGGNFLMFATLRTQGTDGWNAGGVFRSDDGANSWEEISGDLPTFGVESGLAYCYWRIAVDPGDPNLLLVGTRRDWAWDQMGVYRTTNAMATNGAAVTWNWDWNFENLDAAFGDWSWLDPDWWLDQHIHLLAFAPGDANLVIAGADVVMKSSDKGLTWTEAYSINNGNGTFTGRGIELMVIFDVTVDPSKPATWWLGYDDMGLMKSSDAGLSFQRMDATQAPETLESTDCACQIIVDPDNSDILYMVRHGGVSDAPLGWPNGYLFRSTDGGTSWSQLGNDTIEGGRPKLLMFPGGTLATRKLLALVYGKGLYISENSGTTWTASNTGIAVTDLTKLWSAALHPGDADVVYIGSADASPDETTFTGSIYRSSDGGSSWNRLGGASVPSGQINDLAVASTGVSYAATTSSNAWLQAGEGPGSSGLYRSADDGATWSVVLDQPRVDGVAVRPDDPTNVAAAVSSFWNQLDGTDFDRVSPGIYLSTDNGMTFSRSTQGLTHTFFSFVKYNPADTSQIIAGTLGGGYFTGSPGTYAIDTSSNAPITGLWWKASESGWGVTLTQQFGVIGVTIFTYDLAGGAHWYVAACTVSGADCTGELFEVSGGSPITEEWDGSNKQTDSVGTIEFSFTSNDAGTMSFTIDGTSGSKAITRQVFNTDDGNHPLSGLYWIEAESGWGVTMTQQTNIVAATVFTYDENGGAHWYVAANTLQEGMRYTGLIYEVSKVTGLTEVWDGSNKVTTEVGSMEVIYSDNDNAVMNFTINGVDGSKTITRQIWATSGNSP